MPQHGIFEFEQDFAGSLHCIPMAVRLKLDLAGIKLSLRQWNRIGQNSRMHLLAMPCETAAEITAFQQCLRGLIADLGELPAPLPEPADLAWQNTANVPAQILNHAAKTGLPAPSPAQWAALTKLQRYTLLKLSRDHHDNINYLPALREFGITA